MEEIKMSLTEVNQIGTFEKLLTKEIKQKEAAKKLGISTRQVRRKLKEFKCLGPVSLAHKLRGNPSNNKMDKNKEEAILKIVKEEYPGFGPTLAAEKLLEKYNIEVNTETLRLKMTDAKLWIPQKRKIKHKEWRERKECLGELVQLDGSDHDWFEGRRERCTLLAFIDDATSKILHLEFADESTRGVMVTARKYFLRYGLPVEFYVDRGKVFKVNKGNIDDERLTQFGRAMKELEVKITYARSPQAKGRVERTFGTHQDRLVKELRLRNIKVIEEANLFIEEEYLPKHNDKFAKEPKSSADLHRSLEGYDLENIFSIKERRVLTSDFTLRYKNQWFQLEKEQKTIIRSKEEITIVTSLNGKRKLFVRNTELFFHEIDKPAKKTGYKKSGYSHESMARKPAKNHPWRNSFKIKRKEDISTLEKEDILTLV